VFKPNKNKMSGALDNIQSRFIYTKDGRVDTWVVTKGNGPIEDDCDGYALTMLWKLSGENWFRFWWLQITFQACIWYVTSYNGNGHAALWYKGWWTDNMEDGWYKTRHMRHKRRLPYYAPMVLLKMFVGKVLG